MSTPGNKPPDRSITLEPETEKRKGWSQEDKRLFLITFLGGLGANVGVVLIVAAAVAADRFGFRSHNPLWVTPVFILGGVILGMLITLVIREIAPGRTTRKFFVIYYGLYGLVWGLLILLGYAVGIGK